MFLRGSVLGPLFFLLCLNDLPNITADLSKPGLFADDTSIITANPSPSKFKKYINSKIENISYWFGVNSLSLNFDKTYILQYMTKHNNEINIKISCDNNWIQEIKNTDQSMFKLGTTCSAVRCQSFMSHDTIRTIYFSYFPSILLHGIIFWGNSAYSSNIFKMQKRINGVIMNARNRDSF